MSAKPTRTADGTRGGRSVPPPGHGGPDGNGPALLVYRVLKLGDFATAVPALRALERARPERHRVLAGPSSYRSLVRLAGLDWEVLPTPELHTPAWNRQHPPELAVNLHGRGPRSTEALDGLRPRQLWTHGHPSLPELPGPPWPGDVHDADIWCRLLEHHGVAADPRDLYWPVPQGVSRGERAVLHPGASAESRCWPVERFAEVARHLSRMGLEVVVTGSSEEEGRARRVAEEAGLAPESVAAGRTSLEELAALVAGARLVLCGDTGIAHLATAYATPSVRLFGPVPPALWGPRVDGDLHACLWAGRRGDPHAAAPDPGLLALETDEVVKRCTEILSRTEPGSAAEGILFPSSEVG